MFSSGGWLCWGETVGLGAGLEDVGVEGNPVDDGGDEAGIGEKPSWARLVRVWGGTAGVAWWLAGQVRAIADDPALREPVREGVIEVGYRG
jgi:hypothetical protein